MNSISLPTISCTEPACGVCCMQQAGLPISYYMMEGDLGSLPPELAREIQQTAQRWNGLGVWQGPGDDAPCVWFDQKTRKCKHYEHRPDICRDFEVGGEGCLLWREKLLESSHAG